MTSGAVLPASTGCLSLQCLALAEWHPMAPRPSTSPPRPAWSPLLGTHPAAISNGVKTRKGKLQPFQKREEKKTRWAYTDHIALKPLKNFSPNKYFLRNWKTGRRRAAANWNFLQQRELRIHLTNESGVTWERDCCLGKGTLQMASRSLLSLSSTLLQANSLNQHPAETRQASFQLWSWKQGWRTI